MSVIHGELSKVDAILATPDLEMVKVLDCGFLRGQHQNDVLLVILSDHHLHFGMRPINQSSFSLDRKNCKAVYNTWYNREWQRHQTRNVRQVLVR